MKLFLKITAAVLLLACMSTNQAFSQAKTAAKPKQSTAQPASKTSAVIADTVFFELPDSGNYKSDRPSYDELPEFPGGTDALNKYILENTRYPESAVKDKIEGRVFMRFAIEVDGSLADIQVFIGLSSDLNDECMRVLKGMPKWKPGTTVMKAARGWYRTPVRWMYSIPFTFSLTKSENDTGVIITPK